MKEFPRSFGPGRFAGQIALLILAVIAIFHIVTHWTTLLSDANHSRPLVDPADATAAAIIAIDAADPARRPAVIAALDRASPWSRLRVQAAAPPDWNRSSSAEARELGARLWEGAEIRAPTEPGDATLLGLTLHDGAFLVIETPEPRRTPDNRRATGRASALGFGAVLLERNATLFFLFLAVLSIWLSTWVTSPLVRLARQAESFPDRADVKFKVLRRGPREVVELSNALYRMQDRIRSMLAARSHALAAISHDLKTIITRMRLRLEFLSDEGARARLTRDLDSMDGMLAKNLEYLHDAASAPSMERVDLDSLLQTLADEQADLGRDVVYRGSVHAQVSGSLPDTQRLFANLIENAVRYADTVVVTATRLPGGYVQVDVADDGPGIAAADRERVMEPFVRGDDARNLNRGASFGLGLSIVRVLSEKAGGRVELLDNMPRGLVARVRLPQAPDAPGAAQSNIS